MKLWHRWHRSGIVVLMRFFTLRYDMHATVDFRNFIVLFWAETLARWNPTSCQKNIHYYFVRIWDSQIDNSKIEIMETDRSLMRCSLHVTRGVVHMVRYGLCDIYVITRVRVTIYCRIVFSMLCWTERSVLMPPARRGVGWSVLRARGGDPVAGLVQGFRRPDHQGNPHVRESLTLAPVRPRTQAAGLKCLLQITVAFPNPQTRAFSGTELSRKIRSPKFVGQSFTAMFLLEILEEYRIWSIRKRWIKERLWLIVVWS